VATSSTESRAAAQTESQLGKNGSSGWFRSHKAPGSKGGVPLSSPCGWATAHVHFVRSFKGQGLVA
jgi:hypothetical protein